MGQTISEKIFSEACGRRVFRGDFVTVPISCAMVHDGTGPLAIGSFRAMGGVRVWDPDRIVMVIDHVAPSASEGTSILHKQLRNFSLEQGIANFFDVGVGICHQLMVEMGRVHPGDLMVGADSHSCTYGALGAFSTGIGSTEMAAVFLSGRLWFRVPETTKILIEGALPRMVTPKDVILKIIGEVGANGATYRALEFGGSTVTSMSLAGRMTLCNMAVEMGAKTGIVVPDSRTRTYMARFGVGSTRYLTSDSDAEYADVLHFKVDDLEPQVACPHSVDNVRAVSEVEGIGLNQIFIGSCTNGRFEDLEVAAKILRGRKVKGGVRVIVVPASREVYLRALREGLIEIFLKSGCVVCNPGCGPCAGAHQGVLAPGEVCLSTSNRNFIGRMGCAEAEIYLASPATAATSAIEGRIMSPKSLG